MILGVVATPFNVLFNAIILIFIASDSWSVGGSSAVEILLWATLFFGPCYLHTALFAWLAYEAHKLKQVLHPVRSGTSILV
jgi:hypothetical protein